MLEQWTEKVGSRIECISIGVEQGSSTTPRPCDQRFLDFLVRDLQDLKQTLILLDPIMEGLDDTMDPTRSMLSQNIVRIMEECRRLRAAPELFPTASSRKVFFKMISIIADQLAGFAQLKACAADFEQRARNSIKHQPAAPVLAKRVGKIWFKTYQNGSSEQRQKLPDLHPHSFSTKKPWNKWLDNFEEPAYPGIYTSIITQRIPLVALKLIQRHRFMYGVVKRSYEAANRVIRKQKNEKELSWNTGEDYSLSNQLPNVFRQRLGFLTGCRKQYDSKGVVTPEYLSKIVRRFQKRRFARPTEIYPVCSLTRA